MARRPPKRAVDDPATVAKHFERFVAADYAYAAFADGLYRALSLSFGFIAHFDRAGFYAARFADPVARIDTFLTMTEPTPWAATPLESALHQVVVARGLLDQATRQAAADRERTERAELDRLKAKYEEEIDPFS